MGLRKLDSELETARARVGSSLLHIGRYSDGSFWIYNGACSRSCKTLKSTLAFVDAYCKLRQRAVDRMFRTKEQVMSVSATGRVLYYNHRTFHFRQSSLSASIERAGTTR